MSASPPRIAAWLVEHSLPRDPSERDAVLGDLAEEHADLVRSAGAHVAGTWYWRQVFASVGPNLRRRLARPRVPVVDAPTTGGRMDSIVQDVRYSMRMFRRRPTFSAVALASLVLGVSLTAVVFSLLNAVLLRPLPVADPSRLAVLLEVRQDSINHQFSYPDFVDYRASQQSLDGLAAYSRVNVTVRGRDGSRIVAGELVSGNFFDVLGVRMRLGRGLRESDDRPGAQPVVVVGESLWEQIAGEGAGETFTPVTVVVNAVSFEIVGVAVDRFRGMEVGRDARIWAPIQNQPVLDPSGGQNFVPRRTTSWLTLIGRLRPGITRESAAADLTAIELGVSASAGRPRPMTLTFAPGSQGDSALPQVTGGPLELLLGAAVLVLLVACANVAGLLLARAAERAREIAVRSALGAGGLRLARLVLVETLLLGATGAAASLLVTRWLAGLAVPFISRFGEPATLDVSLDWRVVLFVTAVGVGATVLAGLAPMLTAFRTLPSRSLVETARSTSAGRAGNGLRRGLIVAQFSLSLALVVVAALLARTVYNLRTTSTGFDINHVALLGVDPEAAQLGAAETAAYLRDSIDRVSRTPGVRAAGFGRIIPLGFAGARETISVPGYEPHVDEDMEVNFNTVSPTYFDAMGIGLLAGRGFDDGDREGRTPVAIVNETMARRYWPHGDAIARQVRFGDKTLEVVGIARDVKYRALREPSRPSLYLPLGQVRATAGVIHVRTAGDPGVLLDTLRRTLADVNAAVPVTTVRTLREQALLNLNDERLAMIIGVALGGAALLLAAVGLFGAMSYVVGQRSRELGVRIALGATAADVRRLVLGQGLTVSLAGTAIGSALAIWLSRLLESRLFGVRPADIPTLILSAALLAAVAVVASWIPARRASSVDPVTTLRGD